MRPWAGGAFLGESENQLLTSWSSGSRPTHGADGVHAPATSPAGASTARSRACEEARPTGTWQEAAARGEQGRITGSSLGLAMEHNGPVQPRNIRLFSRSVQYA
jgi:hypothetical protein